MKTLLAVDGSDNSYEAVHALKYFARADQLTLLHALDVPWPAYSMMLPPERSPFRPSSRKRSWNCMDSGSNTVRNQNINARICASPYTSPATIL